MVRTGTHLDAEGRALIFDLDGTLVENMPWHARAWAALFEEAGMSIDPGTFIRETAGKLNAEILRERFGAARACVLSPS
jgi:beta-phosphoglucomutase